MGSANQNWKVDFENETIRGQRCENEIADESSINNQSETFEQRTTRSVTIVDPTFTNARSGICHFWSSGGGTFFQCAQKKALPIRVPALFFGGFSWEWKRKKEGDWVRLRLAPLLSGNTVVPLHEHGLLIIVVLEFLIDAVLRQWNLSPCIFLRNRCSH